jgi:hypothetical protein
MSRDPDFDVAAATGSGRTTAITVPYNRAPNHIPRRDFVLGAADRLWLQVSIVECDDPSAEALTLTGGIGGPGLRMGVWPVGDYPTSWDYGMPTPACGTLLWSGNGTISAMLPGTFDVVLPVGTMAAWPRRCGYGLQLDWDSATGSELLCAGILHIRRALFASPAPIGALTTDAGAGISPDGSSGMLVA